MTNWADGTNLLWRCRMSKPYPKRCDLCIWSKTSVSCCERINYWHSRSVVACHWQLISHRIPSFIERFFSDVFKDRPLLQAIFIHLMLDCRKETLDEASRVIYTDRKLTTLKTEYIVGKLTTRQGKDLYRWVRCSASTLSPGHRCWKIDLRFITITEIERHRLGRGCTILISRDLPHVGKVYQPIGLAAALR